MNNYLVKFEANYADEFDVYGFTIVRGGDLGSNPKKVMEALSNDETEFEFFFGSNEDLQWNALEHLEIVPISDEVGEVIGGYLLNHQYSYGHFPRENFNELLEKYKPL